MKSTSKIFQFKLFSEWRKIPASPRKQIPQKWYSFKQSKSIKFLQFPKPYRKTFQAKNIFNKKKYSRFFFWLTLSCHRFSLEALNLVVDGNSEKKIWDKFLISISLSGICWSNLILLCSENWRKAAKPWNVLNYETNREKVI